MDRGFISETSIPNTMGEGVCSVCLMSFSICRCDKTRTFETGATRDSDKGKPDYEGFLSPIVIHRFGTYMLKHTIQSDGKSRSSDNWQKGMPKEQYIKSLYRHVQDMCLEHRGCKSQDGMEEAICAIIFNAQGYLHELLKERRYLK